MNQGNVTSAQIPEDSGVIASPSNANVLWMENDSGNPNTIFAVDTTGHLLGSYTLSGSTNTDWEDIAQGPGPEPGVNYLYLYEAPHGGQTTVYRVPEPTVYASQQVGSPVTKTLTGVTSQTFTMTGGAAVTDGESMFIDPTDGALYFGTKESGVTRFFKGTQAQFSAVGTQAATQLTHSVALSKGNGADISYDGSQIIVRNGGTFADLYHRAPGQTIDQALGTAPTFVGVNGQSIEPNAEAIAFDPDGKNFYTHGEGLSQGLYLYTRTSNDAPLAHNTIIAQGATWKYLDGGTTPDAHWNGQGYPVDFSSWHTGSGPFGYGQGQEHQVISFGGNPSNKPASYEFVTTFNVADLHAFNNVTLKLLVDDGAAVYLNGVEITRFNLAANAGLGTFAQSGVADALQNTWRSFAIDRHLLHLGSNTIAVEVHGSSATDADLRFDAQLVNVGVVPEPSTLVLAGIGLGGLGVAAQRRRMKAKKTGAAS